MPKVFDLMEVGFNPIQAKHLGANAINGDFNNLSATGNNDQATAYQIEANYNIFTTVGGSANSAKLPKAESDPHGVYYILNLGAEALNLFPFSGDSFNNLAVDTSILVPVGTGVILVKQTINSWQSHATFGSNSPDLTGYVPYTGANQYVDLNAQGLSNVGYVLVNETSPYDNSVVFEANGAGGFNNGSQSAYFAKTEAGIFTDGTNTVTICNNTNAIDASGDIYGNNLSGTNTGDVTLSGTPDYITISGQDITRNQIDLTTDVTGILPVARGGSGQGVNTLSEVIFSIGNTVNNTASAVSYTSGNVGTVPVNYFAKAGDAVHAKFKNYFGANTGTGRAMLFRIDPSTDADSDFYSTGSVGWTGEVVEMDVILYRRTLTEMRIEWSVKSTTSVNTCGRVALPVTTYNQTFNIRSYIRGSVANEVQAEYLSGIGIKSI